MFSQEYHVMSRLPPEGISYEDYIAFLEQLQDLHDARETKVMMTAIKADPSSVRPFREVVAEMVAAGEINSSIIPPSP